MFEIHIVLYELASQTKASPEAIHMVVVLTQRTLSDGSMWKNNDCHSLFTTDPPRSILLSVLLSNYVK